MRILLRLAPVSAALALAALLAVGTEDVRADEEHGFSGLFDDAAAGQGVLLFLLLASFAWGALHALSPGHGKAMVAAYLVGTRGTARHAVLLGATVTVSHTIGVFALGLVALLLSAAIVPEDLLPWLNLTAGLLVVVVGASVLRARLRGEEEGHRHEHDRGDGHVHHHGEPVSRRGLVALGTAAGLIPCPSALVVLLAAIAQHEVALGLLLVLAFSLGLAATVTVLGVAVVWAAGLTTRLPVRGRVAVVVRALPAVSAVVIVGAGVLLTAQAVPQLR